VGKDGNVSAGERQDESVIPEETIGGSLPWDGKVGKDGNVSAGERQDESVIPEETIGHASGWRARI
jgi:hypothetical protein